MSDSDYNLSDTQREHLAAVLDRIIPPSPDSGLPGAGESGIGDYIESVLRSNPAQRLAIEPGLACFADLLRDGASTDKAFEAIQEKEPAFVPTLVFHTYSGYYQHPRVLEALGLDPRPPHPQGYEMAPFDPALLDKVRRRGKIYRDV